MIQIGDLVKDTYTGKIGIVIRHDPIYVNYYEVQFHDNIYSIHSYNLKPLEKL
jgi:hypothetical protein